MNKVSVNNNIQKLAPGIVSIAEGYATKARASELVLSETGDWISIRYPTVAKTEKPARKENEQLQPATVSAFLMIGAFYGLYEE